MMLELNSGEGLTVSVVDPRSEQHLLGARYACVRAQPAASSFAQCSVDRPSWLSVTGSMFSQPVWRSGTVMLDTSIK